MKFGEVYTYKNAEEAKVLLFCCRAVSMQRTEKEASR